MESPAAAEVVLIGTIHHFHLLHPDNSPAHLRALLRRVRPAVIAVENPPDWQQAGRHLWTQLVEYQVAESYAREYGIPVYGVDVGATAECYWAEQAPDPTDALVRSDAARAGFRSLASFEATVASADPSWALRQIQDRIDAANLDEFARERLDDGEAMRRDDRIAEAVAALAREHAGQRIAVLLGNVHLYPQRARLEKVKDLRLLDAREFLPTASEIDEAWRLSDIVMVLGSAVDSWNLPVTAQARDDSLSNTLLAKLAQLDSTGMLVTYYTAKRHMLLEEYREASTLLDQVASESVGAILPWIPNSEWSWPPWQDLRRKAAFARAVIYDLEGQHAAAVRLYRQLAAAVPEQQLRPRIRGPRDYYDLRWYLEDLAGKPYEAGLWEVFRVQEARRCWPSDRVPEDSWPR